MTVRSMTGFAARAGETEAVAWRIELKSVNARGLDVRLRLPNLLESIENEIRNRVKARLTRGAVNVSMSLEKRSGAGGELDPAAVSRVLEDIRVVAAGLAEKQLPMAPVAAESLLNLRHLYQDDAGAADPERDKAVQSLMLAEFDQALAELVASREGEGASLGAVITDQVEEIAALSGRAVTSAEAQGEAVAARLGERVTELVAAAGTAGSTLDESRLAQELALIAVKSDIREEIDRLDAHVTAARSLLRDAPPIGRKLDFLTQEFNREANTICSKAGSNELTQIGLQLKVVVDQMREQVQNIE